MVSFKQYLSISPKAGPNGEQDDTYPKLVSILIEAVAVHAVEYRLGAKLLFQSSIRQIAAKLETKPQTEALAVGAEVIHALQRYNLEVETFVSAKAKELHSMLAMLTSTVVQICGRTATSSQNLVELERDLEAAEKIEDLQVLKGRLSGHLKTMRCEIEEQQKRYNELNTLAEQANQGQPTNQITVPERDPATGLPNARAAETAIQGALASGSPVAPVVFVIERLKAINDRYGFAIGDEILMIFGKYLVQRLPNHAIFRWRGPAFLVLLNRDGQSEAVRREIQRAIAGSLEHTVSTGSRSVLLPVRWTWAMIPVTPATQANQVTEEMDRFVAKQFSMSA